MAEGKNKANPDCILTAAGYGTTVVPLVSFDFGLNVIATEDMGRDNRIFYPMQAQEDTFSISAIFASKAKSNDFNRWIWRYAEFAATPGAAIAVGLRVQVPARRFDFMGFPISGWSYHFAPVQLNDVTWVVTINFDGAAPVGPHGAVTPSYYTAPTDPSATDQLMFYPSYYQPGTDYTGNPADSLYGKPAAPK
jgi:hypothetical protein